MINDDWSNILRAWENFKYLAKGIEIINFGYKTYGEFEADQVTISIDRDFALPFEIIDHIRNPLSKNWYSEGRTNDEQIGLYQIKNKVIIDYKIVDSRIHLSAQRYRYFDALATNFTYANRSEGIDFLEQAIQSNLFKNNRSDVTFENPLEIFPNPLSVGLSLLCENGNKLVLTRRSSIQSSGGNLSGGLIFNAMGENINPDDIQNNKDDNTLYVSPWTTAQRGLLEETGFDSIPISSIKLHTFVWDKPRLDYKFFGYLTLNAPKRFVVESFNLAPDKREFSEIFFIDISNKNACLDLLRLIRINKKDWSKEAIFCTILTLLSQKRISNNDLHYLNSE